MTQTQSIADYLKSGNSLTPLQALEMFGCFRLAARIKELKDSGYSINTHKLKLPNGKSVASYRMAIR